MERRRTGEGEHRLPPAVAVLAAGLLYALLPSSLVVGPRYAVPAVEASLALAVLMVATNLVSLGLLVVEAAGQGTSGSSLLVAALQV